MLKFHIRALFTEKFIYREVLRGILRVILVSRLFIALGGGIFKH
jgi:hypothetical protein